MVKMKYLEFSTRWNQAESIIPNCLEATQILSWFLQKDGSQIWDSLMVIFELS